MILAIGNDHAGIGLKTELSPLLEGLGLVLMNMGTDTAHAVDYPDYAAYVADAVLSGRAQAGLLICGTGIGMSIAANRRHGIRAALCHDVFSARATRLHNNANVLVLGARVVGPGHAEEIARAFFTTDFSNEQRHLQRIGKL